MTTPATRIGPGLLVLDFDGVVCDGMDEFFESSWRAWQSLNLQELPAASRSELHDRFARLRPVVEAGWEMVLLMGILASTAPAQDAELQEPERWARTRDVFRKACGQAQETLFPALESARDAWLATDRDGWLRCHRFYPGIADWLRRLVGQGQLVYILSTKHKRFLDDLISWQGVPLPGDRVIGRATPRKAKWEVIHEVATRHGLPSDGAGVWFVEDRLETLLEFRSAAAHLGAARLFLADWGYVFPRDVARARPLGFTPLALAEATGPFEGWPAR
jgi:phosphoglycolate phosphatase-like HAD superfamily hydrolase